jgi:hypothetical protein
VKWRDLVNVARGRARGDGRSFSEALELVVAAHRYVRELHRELGAGTFSPVNLALLSAIVELDLARDDLERAMVRLSRGES